MSAFTELRPWLRRLAETDRMAVCKPGVDLHFELAAIAKSLDGHQAVAFPQPSGHQLTVVSNIVSSRQLMAEVIGTEEQCLLERFQNAADNPLAWHEVQNAPMQSVVHREVDIAAQLPVPVHNEHDGGKYISAGLLISRDPDSGQQNVSINRCQIHGGNRLGVLILPRHTWTFFDRAEQRGKALEIAIVIGVDPCTLLASQAIVPIGHDELEIAGALHGAPLPVVKCLSNNVRVPATAESVLEGRVLANVREQEGPFGEFPQYYGAPAKRHVIEIDTITHRRNPLYHTITGGGLEHLVLGQIPREATLLSHLRRSFPNVKNVHLPKGGVCRYSLVVQMEKKQEGEARHVMLGAFSGHYDIKQVTVVDTDVDIYNAEEVEWAVITRSQADRDYLIIPSALGSKLDPSSDDGIGAKLGIDATKPLKRSDLQYQRIRIPGEDDVDLNTCIDPVSGLEFLERYLAESNTTE